LLPEQQAPELFGAQSLLPEQQAPELAALQQGASRAPEKLRSLLASSNKRNTKKKQKK
jgi:hypothetical protein